MFFDYTYLVLVLPAVLLAMWASARVHSTFRRYQGQLSRRRITGADAARAVLNANGLSDVRIERVSGSLTDHYDPRQCHPSFRQRLRRHFHRRHRRRRP